MDSIYDVIGEEKPNQKIMIKIQAEWLDKYFPDNFSPQQKIEVIEENV